MSNYPPGFGSARDLDHVEGPLSETPIEGEACPECGDEPLTLLRWRGGGDQVVCAFCSYEREAAVRGEEDA